MKRRKKRFVLPLCLLLLLSLCAPAYAAADAPFADIHGHWAECHMTWAQEAGILTGTSSTTLSPDDTATRAMAVTVLYRYAGSPAVEGTSGFADVPADAYYADSAAWAAQAGIAAGKTETAFCPNAPVSKEDFAVMLYRLCTARHGVPEVSPDALVNIEDAGNIHGYARDAVAWAVEDLVLVNKNLPLSRLLPQASLTRGDLAHLLRQYDCLVEGNPAQLYRFDPDEVEKIAVDLYQGEVTFLITEPAEIQRFVEKVNGFSYTGQHTPAGAGKQFPYHVVLWFKDLELPKGLFMDSNRIGNFYSTSSPDQPYFTSEWFQSFYPTA